MPARLLRQALASSFAHKGCRVGQRLVVQTGASTVTRCSRCRVYGAQVLGIMTDREVQLDLALFGHVRGR